jgi:serine/threonine protein kinase
MVSVLRHGPLSVPSYYFIDMELCDMNLESYIRREWTDTVVKNAPYFTIDQPPRMRTAQIWDIVEDIAEGVAFIHSNGITHRDLKPRNGNYPAGRFTHGL